MTLSSYCMCCLVERQKEYISQYADEAKKAQYMKEVLLTIANAGEDSTAPVVIAKINELHETYFDTAYSFEDLKFNYNSLMMSKESSIRQQIQNSKDPLLTAIKYARIGNYIDFGAMGSIDSQKLDSLLESVTTEQIPENEYANFKHDLSLAKYLVYLPDNCGEIVLDKLLIEVLKKQYPHINITVIVRGFPVLNDVTLSDVEMVGLKDLVPILSNGTKIAGTSLNHINMESLNAIQKADVIVSKGQGNFESLHGCGLNIYYMFLCKCDWFVKRFQLERFQGVFQNEKNFEEF